MEQAKSVQRQCPGIVIPELVEFDSVECPELFLDYYEDFLSLNQRRTFQPMVMSSQGNTMTINQPMPISYKDIEAWAFCFGVTPTGIQTRVITMLDNIWLRVYNKLNK